MKTGTNHILSAIRIFEQYKNLAEKAILQLDQQQLFICLEPESNSIAVVMKHMAGNMLSRWTDFLFTDGEKEWRNRDAEFEIENSDSFSNMMAYWNKGWQCLFDTLNALEQEDLACVIKIRGEELSVMEAINRQLAHYSYHAGQIVFIAKAIRSEKWETLSIAKGKSGEFNDHMKGK